MWDSNSALKQGTGVGVWGVDFPAHHPFSLWSWAVAAAEGRGVEERECELPREDASLRTPVESRVRVH